MPKFEKVYGYHKENAETMFESQQCKIQSFNNDKEIFKSMETISNLEFFNLVSSRKILYKTILNVFAHHDNIMINLIVIKNVLLIYVLTKVILFLQLRKEWKQ
ncbi:hypothetical protein TYRP_023679 [Tyrophagus putrescentiae]|nr:hypothetical protein TYRP_023679 [Tyrophagus putrescentiae]